MYAISLLLRKRRCCAAPTTVKLVEDTGARIVAKEADVRDRASLSEALQAGVDEFGRLDIVVANAGIAPMAAGDDGWRDVIDVNLAGVHHTVDVAIPIMIAGHRRRRRVDQFGGWLGSCRRGQRRRDRIRRGKARCGRADAGVRQCACPA